MMPFSGTRFSMSAVSRVAALFAFAFCIANGIAGAQPVTDQRTFSGQSFETTHHGTFNGVAVDYVATFDETLITGEDGKETASFFATSYVRKDVTDAASRPVVFFWNGGPSSPSMWLHIAGFGPRRLVVPAAVDAPIAPPYETTDNEHTILDVADLVFIDPVETGFSRILPAGDKDHFYSDDGDAASNAQFVQAWSAKNGRERSPKFILGSSYGSIRAALVAGILADSSMTARNLTDSNGFASNRFQTRSAVNSSGPLKKT